MALLSIGILSGRTKAYGFFVISAFIIYYINDRFELKFNFKNSAIFLAVLGVITIVAWEKINLYFIQGGFGGGREANDLYARMALYYFSTFVIIQQFTIDTEWIFYMD